jgi:hypothetical protein
MANGLISGQCLFFETHGSLRVAQSRLGRGKVVTIAGALLNGEKIVQLQRATEYSVQTWPILESGPYGGYACSKLGLKSRAVLSGFGKRFVRYAPRLFRVSSVRMHFGQGNTQPRPYNQEPIRKCVPSSPVQEPLGLGVLPESKQDLRTRFDELLQVRRRLCFLRQTEPSLACSVRVIVPAQLEQTEDDRRESPKCVFAGSCHGRDVKSFFLKLEVLLIVLEAIADASTNGNQNATQHLARQASAKRWEDSTNPIRTWWIQQDVQALPQQCRESNPLGVRSAGIALAHDLDRPLVFTGADRAFRLGVHQGSAVVALHGCEILLT